MSGHDDTEHRDFLRLDDFNRGEILALLDLAEALKRGERGRDMPLTGKTLVMIFRKSSTRTRVSFEAGMTQLGGHAIFLADRDSQIGRGESSRDTGAVLSRYADAIMIRTFGHDEVETLAEYATIPVINGLTDLVHPCQLLADLQTIRQSFSGDLRDLVITWIGDGNNMANSWVNAAAVMGFELRLGCPPGYGPDPEILRRAESVTRVSLLEDPHEATAGAHVVTTDVWASMGQEEEQSERMSAFEGFCVDSRLMSHAAPDAIFLHCLPAHRGEEVTAEVIDGPQSRVYDEAENRLHAQKALLLTLISN